MQLTADSLGETGMKMDGRMNAARKIKRKNETPRDYSGLCGENLQGNAPCHFGSSLHENKVLLMHFPEVKETSKSVGKHGSYERLKIEFDRT